MSLKPPRPRLPTTTSCAFFASSINHRAAVTYDPPLHIHIWVLLLPSRQTLREQFASLLFVSVPIHLQDWEHADVAPGVQCHQADAAPRRFVECQSGGTLGRW
jgi:hypothetical protein